MAGFAGGTCSGASGFGAKAQDIGKILERAQYDAQLRRGVLAASGGELEVGKAKLHIIHYGFCGSGRPAMLLPKAGAQATQAGARDGTREPIALQPLYPSDSRKMMGCHNNEPEGNSLASLSWQMSTGASAITMSR